MGRRRMHFGERRGRPRMTWGSWVALKESLVASGGRRIEFARRSKAAPTLQVAVREDIMTFLPTIFVFT